jgi:fibrillarin-like rRNA methylase
MHSTLNSNYFLKKEEKQIIELAMEAYAQTKTPRELITEAFKLLKQKALQTVREKEIKKKEAEAEMEKLHLELRKNKEFMNLQAEDLDDFIYA